MNCTVTINAHGPTHAFIILSVSITRVLLHSKTKEKSLIESQDNVWRVYVHAHLNLAVYSKVPAVALSDSAGIFYSIVSFPMDKTILEHLQQNTGLAPPHTGTLLKSSTLPYFQIGWTNHYVAH